MDTDAPTFQDVLQARRLISSYLRPTPLYHYAALDKLVGAAIYVKHENHLPVGAFKLRGGINLLGQLSEEEPRGVSSPLRPAITVSPWPMLLDCLA